MYINTSLAMTATHTAIAVLPGPICQVHTKVRNVSGGGLDLIMLEYARNSKLPNSSVNYLIMLLTRHFTLLPYFWLIIMPVVSSEMFTTVH